MVDKGPPWLTFTTPVERAPAVSIYREQWEGHVLAGHPEMLGQENRVGEILRAPTTVAQLEDASGYLLFVNSNVTSPGGNTPMVACVDPEEQFLVTSYYDRRLLRGVPGLIIWQR